MANHHFISYSVADAPDFALKLCDELVAGPPAISAWLDKRDILPGQDWDKQIVEAIKTCHSLFLVMTKDSVEDESGCKNECTWAIKYKKPIIPILLHQEAEMPFQLGSRQYIDFTGEFQSALAKLRNHIKWLDSPAGRLQALKDRLTDANRDLRRTDDPIQQTRIKDDIEGLKKQITDQEQIIKDPEGTKERVEKSISAGIKRAQQPKKPITGISKTKFINPPPGIAPTYFQDRHVETKLVGEFLQNDTERMITVVGRAGIGKTAMVCRLLKYLEAGRLPDDVESLNGGKELNVDGIVYLSERGSRKVSFTNLYFDLCRLLQNEVAQNLDEVYKDPATSTTEKMKALLHAFPKGRFVVLLDNFEDKVNTETLKIEDEEVNEALITLLNSEQHTIKIILTTRVAPRDLALIKPSMQRRLDLDEGLDSPYAENILREMDTDGKVGLKEATDEVLDEVRKRTNGYPRALEALFAILSADRDTSLTDILTDAEKLLPEHVVEKMVGEAFNRLDPDAQMVMQALAIYGRPVSNVALDYMLQPYIEGVDSAKVLNRLVNMQFVRKEGTLYYLHPVDREYSLGRISEGEPGDRLLASLPLEIESAARTIFSQYALLNRGAQFFKETRLPREDWKNLDDLAPQLAEFELRFQSQDYDTAVGVLLEIDFNYLILWGQSRLVVEYHQRLLGNIKDDQLKGASLNNLGICYFNLGDYHKAIEYFLQYLNIARKISDRNGEGYSLGNLSTCYSMLGDNPKAIEHQKQSLNISQEISDRKNEGKSLGNLGSYYKNMGNYLKAIEYQQQSLNIAQEIGDHQGEGASLGNLGICYFRLGNYPKAIDHHQQFFDIARLIGDRLGEGNALGNLGNCYFSQGDYSKAIDHHQECLDIALEIGDRLGEGVALNNLASALLFLGNIQRAQKHLYDSVTIFEEIGSPEVVEGYCLLGIVFLKSGKYQKGKTEFEKTVKQADTFLQKEDRVGTIDFKALALCGLAVCEQDKMYANKGKEAFAQVRVITKAEGDVDGILKFFDLISELDKKRVLVGVREVAAGLNK